MFSILWEGCRNIFADRQIHRLIYQTRSTTFPKQSARHGRLFKPDFIRFCLSVAGFNPHRLAHPPVHTKSVMASPVSTVAALPLTGYNNRANQGTGQDRPGVIMDKRTLTEIRKHTIRPAIVRAGQGAAELREEYYFTDGRVNSDSIR
jgi:hypothetical protein